MLRAVADERSLPSGDVAGVARGAVVRPGDAAGTGTGWPELDEWVRRHRVVLAGLALIAAQLVWKAFFLGHFFFWQDDYRFLDRGLDNGLTWKYLMWVDAGHLLPGPFAISWAVARIALYDWPFAAGVTLVLLAGACLALLRLLRNLFGDRPAILIPLAVYLFTPLTLAESAWWAGAIEALPLQLATFMALDEHIRYVRTRRFRHAVAAASWMLAGMLFFEKGMVLPLLLFAVTSAFFVPGRWDVAARHAVAGYWRAWLLYAIPLAAYAALFVTRLNTSGNQPGPPGPYRHVLSFISGLVRISFIPGALGGPWKWRSSGALAYSAPPGGLLWVSWIVAAAIVLVSIWNRRYAWRAWAILAGWVAGADIAPIVFGRLRELSGAVLGTETRYLADAAPVLAVCVGLAFLPVVGQRDNRRTRRAPARPLQLATAATSATLGAFLLGSLLSAQAYQNATTSAPARNYIANARAALAAAPHGTVVVDGTVPIGVMTAGWFGRYGFASKVLGELARGDPQHRPQWTRHPQGTIDHLMVFGRDGRLWPAALYGHPSLLAPGGQKCWRMARGKVIVHVWPTRTTGVWTLRVGYFVLRAQQVSVRLGDQVWRVTLRPGLHNVYLPVQGSMRKVIVTGLRGPECIGNTAVGVVVVSNAGPAIPPVPVMG
jgi:hypothetical protein